MVTLDDVSTYRREKARVNHEAYKECWSQCCKCIMYHAKRNENSATFIVTPLVPGMPLIDTRRAARYICDKLKYNNFQVESQSIPPFTVLLISWSQPDARRVMQHAKVKTQEEEKSEPEKEPDLLDDVVALLARRKS